MRVGFIVLTTVFLLWPPVVSYAATRSNYCNETGFSETDQLHVAQVKGGVTHVNFILGSGRNQQCPSLAAECQDKTYLIPGDLVVLGKRDGDVVSALYYKSKKEYGGCLPVNALEPAPLLTDPSDWAGIWKRTEATITIHASDGKLIAEGDATWGADDSERIKNGGVHTGEFSGSFILKDGQAIYNEDVNDENSCRIRLARAGSLLFVQDNSNCGGMNVRFDGGYQRSTK